MLAISEYWQPVAFNQFSIDLNMLDSMLHMIRIYHLNLIGCTP